MLHTNKKVYLVGLLSASFALVACDRHRSSVFRPSREQVQSALRAFGQNPTRPPLSDVNRIEFDTIAVEQLGEWNEHDAYWPISVHVVGRYVYASRATQMFDDTGVWQLYPDGFGGFYARFRSNEPLGLWRTPQPIVPER